MHTLRLLTCVCLHCARPAAALHRCLDKAAIRSDKPPVVSLTEVEETKAFLSILPLFLCICIYQMVGAANATLGIRSTHSACAATPLLTR